MSDEQPNEITFVYEDADEVQQLQAGEELRPGDVPLAQSQVLVSDPVVWCSHDCLSVAYQIVTVVCC
mgnify:CR=1 FL=1